VVTLDGMLCAPAMLGVVTHLRVGLETPTLSVRGPGDWNFGRGFAHLSSQTPRRVSEIDQAFTGRMALR
jgi:hypothetical protein